MVVSLGTARTCSFGRGLPSRERAALFAPGYRRAFYNKVKCILVS